MNVLHVIPSIDREDGGPAAAVDGMTRAIAGRGARVTVATTGRIRDTEANSADGITRLRFPRTLPGSWKYSHGLGSWLSRNTSSFDVVHVHALFSYATIPGCRNAIASGVPLVLRPLGTLNPWSLAHRPWKKRPYLQLIERYHLDGASVIHVTSELERSGVAALGYARKTRSIPLGVDHVAAPEAVRRAHDRAAGRRRVNVLFLSRLHKVKGLPLLIAALGDVRASVQFTLRIGGSGSEGDVAELRRLCAHAGITANVSFLGHVDGTRKQDLLEWADLFVLPSHQESFSIAAVEAMAAGVPVVLSEHVGVAPDAAAAGAGSIIPTDVPAIAAAIRQLAADSDLRLRMGLAGRALVESRFTWSAASDALVELYEELCANRQRGVTGGYSHISFPLHAAAKR